MKQLANTIKKKGNKMSQISPQPLECPDCFKSMILIAGNPGFSYWVCLQCQNEFEYNVFTECFSDKIHAANHLLNILKSQRKEKI